MESRMQGNTFFKLGKLVYRFRIAVICVWIVIILGCVPFLPHLMTPFHKTGFIDEQSKSALADRYLGQELGYNYNRFLVIYHSNDLLATSAAFTNEIKKSLANLKNFPIQHEIIMPTANKKQISKDKHTAYVVILFNNHPTLGVELLKRLQASIKNPPNMTMQLGGEPIFVASINKQTQEDLYKTDIVAAPVSIIILILVFGTLVAAFIPMILGGGCALIMLISLYFLAQLFTLSVFTLNIALLLGLCLSLDYSLFIIYRFREELRKEAKNNGIADIISKTLATAGKAVFFSGFAVFISLSALLLFPINILFSVGIGGLVAVFSAVAIAITLLPAILAVIHRGINRLSVLPHQMQETEKGMQNFDKGWNFWHRIATTIVHRPVFFFISTLIILLFLGHPFLNVRFGISDFNVLPKHSESRQFFTVYQQAFDEQELSPILLVVTSEKGLILSKKHLKNLYQFTDKLKENPKIISINSIVTTDPRLTSSQYHTLYNLSKQNMDASTKQLLKTTTRKHMTLISIVSKYPANSVETRALISELRQMTPGQDLKLQLTGVPVNNAEVLETIGRIFPYAVAWIMILTYLSLLVLLRSLFLPLKALIMNLLSLCASYGILVFIFQEGHLHELLNFTPQGMLDISLLIIIFCALFGFSMDYEVFLLTRIHECYLESQDNDKSIVFGIVKSSRIITSAAVIVIVICGSFMVADVLMVKEFGLGIAVAIFVDAFIIRTMLVPSTMALIKQWNWYLPRWLNKILPNEK